MTNPVHREAGDVKAAIQHQFGRVAANYSTSPIHAVGPDLGRLVELAGLRGTERVLDAGCGTGHTAMALAPQAAQVVAVDLTEPMLAQGRRLAQERGIANVQFRLGDVEQLPFDDRTFDLVASRYSAHHWPHLPRALQEIARVLRPGGRLLLGDTVGFDEPALDTFLNAVELLRDTSHVRDYTPIEWQGALSNAGFAAEIVHRWHVQLAFVSWVERMATPTPFVAAIQDLLTSAAQETVQALRIQESGDFSLSCALFQGTLPT
jgi:SAM-dependent methyltransferase